MINLVNPQLFVVSSVYYLYLYIYWYNGRINKHFVESSPFFNVYKQTLVAHGMLQRQYQGHGQGIAKRKIPKQLKFPISLLVVVNEENWLLIQLIGNGDYPQEDGRLHYGSSSPSH
jgi:hypothetical protein